MVYKVSTYYDPARESGFRFDDPAVGIEWPAGLELIVSERDRGAPALANLKLGLRKPRANSRSSGSSTSR